MPTPIRVVVPIDSHDPAAWTHALTYAQAIAANAQPPATDLILLTHAKAQLNGTSLAGHVGPTNTKVLLANKDVALQGGVRLRHATLQTLRGSVRDAVIIAYFAEDKMLDTIDGLAGIVGVVVVPEFAGDIDVWTARWTPIVHGQQASAPVPVISDTVVDKALQALTGGINIANALLNPRDKAHADETLRILRAKGHTLEPEKVKSWALQNGWKLGAADELAKLAGKVQALKAKPSISGFYNADGKYDSWTK